MTLNRRTMLALGTGATALAMTGTATAAHAREHTGSVPSDSELARLLPGGFRSRCATVNGVRLHYVTGGHGRPLLLVPGWPQTWWAYRKVMPQLARTHRVIAVDLRGMGGSDKPAGGYDKKTMAADLHALVRHLGHRQVDIADTTSGPWWRSPSPPTTPRRPAGWHCWTPRTPTRASTTCGCCTGRDRNRPVVVGGQPAPAAAGTADVRPHAPRDRLAVRPLPRRPEPGRRGRPRDLRARLQQPAGHPGRHRLVPGVPPGHRRPGRLRQADHAVLGIGGNFTYEDLQRKLTAQATDVRMVRASKSVHYLPEEEPEVVAGALLDFFG